MKNSMVRSFADWQPVVLQDQSLIQQDCQLPIKRTRDGYPIRYSSAIAHRLAANCTQSAFEIATELATQILVYQSQQLKNLSDPSLPTKVLQGLTIQASTAGYMQFDFSDGAIANYFNLLIHSLPSKPKFPGPWPCLPSTIPHLHHRIFLLQHTHARCCSLLRLAHENHLIQLNFQEPVNQSGQWQITAPEPLPWLTATLQFHPNHATELQLIAQIVTVLDALDDACAASCNVLVLPASTSKSAITLLTAAAGLSQAFHASHQHWQLMGNLRTQGRDRQQAHLGLLLITQRLLDYLLQEMLHVEAPFAL